MRAADGRYGHLLGPQRLRAARRRDDHGLDGARTRSRLDGCHRHQRVGLALILGGTVACWGSNAHGQLGNGMITDSKVPLPVSNVTGVNALAQGDADAHACAFFTGGGAVCWGEDFYGQLGNGLTTDSNTPVAVSNLMGAATLAVGQSHTCALLPGNSFACWGRNTFGELGIGTTTDSSTPLAASL